MEVCTKFLSQIANKLKKLKEGGFDMLIYNFREIENKKFGKIRAVDQEGRVWFAADDVARALGYFKPKDAVLIHVVSMNEKLFVKPDNSNFEIPKKGMMFINEYGFRQLVRECNVNSADKAKRWLLKEVLPWALESVKEKPDPDKIIEKTPQNTSVNGNIKNMPVFSFKNNNDSSEYCRLIKRRSNASSVTMIAKDYGWSAIRLNKYLEEKGVQVKFNGMWLLNPKYVDRDYTVVGTSKFHKNRQAKKSKGKQKKEVLCTYWTRAGMIFIYNLLKQDGILPLIEQADKNRTVS